VENRVTLVVYIQGCFIFPDISAVFVQLLLLLMCNHFSDIPLHIIHRGTTSSYQLYFRLDRDDLVVRQTSVIQHTHHL